MMITQNMAKFNHMCLLAYVQQTGSSVYQKQMAGLSILPADLHQGALLHKDLI